MAMIDMAVPTQPPCCLNGFSILMYKPVYGDLQGRFQSTSLFPPFPNQKDHNVLLLERGIRAATVPRLLFSRIDLFFVLTLSSCFCFSLSGLPLIFCYWPFTHFDISSTLYKYCDIHKHHFRISWAAVNQLKISKDGNAAMRSTPNLKKIA